METKVNKISNTGYNPKIELMTNSYSTKFYYENSAVKNTTADSVKNKTITISNEIKKQSIENFVTHNYIGKNNFRNKVALVFYTYFINQKAEKNMETLSQKLKDSLQDIETAVENHNRR